MRCAPNGTLRTADGGRPCGVELMCAFHHLIATDGARPHGASVGKERLVAHAPYKNRRVVAVLYYHFFQLLQRILFESSCVGRVDRIGGCSPFPIILRSGCAPEGRLAPEKHSLAVTFFDESLRMGIVGTSNHRESCFFHHSYVATCCFFGHSVAPSGLVLMNIGTVEEKRLAVEEETLVLRPTGTSGSRN